VTPLSVSSRALFLVLCVLADGRADEPRNPAAPLLLTVGRSDADSDGRADRQQHQLEPVALRPLPQLSFGETDEAKWAPTAGPLRLVDAGGRVLGVRANERTPLGSSAPYYLLGMAPGRTALRAGGSLREAEVVDVRAFDGKGHELDWASAWASPSRALPEELAVDEPRDADALHFVLVGSARALPEKLELVSESPSGRYRDSLAKLELGVVPCPPDVHDVGLSCKQTGPVRVVGDAVDRAHPRVVGRSILGEVGGRLRVVLGPSASSSLPIGGPRGLEVEGPGRYRARLRARILRTTRGGMPAVGTSDAEARDLVLSEIALASHVWGQCGIHFGQPGDVDVQVVDPPDASLISVGCDEALPASGGEIALRVEGQGLRLKTSPGQTPEAVAGRLAELLEERGYRVERFTNPRTESAALPTVDLAVRDRTGRLLSLAPDRAGEISSDPSLRVCSLAVHLEDGLDHFSDGDAAAGTLEERTLLRALMDDDARTIDLLIVPVFAGLGRIGESFIFSPGASIQNALILDRGGIRASMRSFTLAHELGHILLDMPGHPDDYGIDRPSSLMDADAADGTIFGPRRLSLADCQRALRQSGPGAPVPLLEAWPLRSPRAP